MLFNIYNCFNCSSTLTKFCDDWFNCFIRLEMFEMFMLRSMKFWTALLLSLLSNGKAAIIVRTISFNFCPVWPVRWIGSKLQRKKNKIKERKGSRRGCFTSLSNIFHYLRDSSDPFRNAILMIHMSASKTFTWQTFVEQYFSYFHANGTNNFINLIDGIHCTFRTKQNRWIIVISALSGFVKI